jgi:(p)ppGpp synthase/HD superfamily hydrolase
MSLKTNLKSIKIERIRRINATKDIDEIALKDWNVLIKKKINENEIKKINFAYDFAKKLKYDHSNSNLYFSHPLRVANMVLLHKRTVEIELIILALNHNILEVSNLSKKKIVNMFGCNFYENISILTVKRKFQWNRNYKKKYYENINNHSHSVKIIKILDKLDNLFIIGLNPNKKVRTMYISEIEEFVLPMVKKYLPDIYLYFKKLVKNSYKIGHYKVNN